MRQIKNQSAALVVLAALTLLSSCSNNDSPPRTEPSPTGDGQTTNTTPDPGYTIVAETHLFGPGRWAMHAAGDPEAPLAVIDVPEGYQGRESYVWTHDGLDLNDYPGQLLYRAPTRVPADPCDVDRPSPRLGSSVEDLAEALTAQKRTTTTRPVPAELGGYRGLYLELRTPGGQAFQACPTDGMVIFEAGRGGERVLEVPATERYWILDVEGRRVVVSAMTPAGARSESVKRVTDVAEAITFVNAAL